MQATTPNQTRPATLLLSPQDEDLRVMRMETARGYYRLASGGGKTRKRVPIHRVIIERMFRRLLQSLEIVDHINGNKADNRRDNLRVVTQSENRRNLHTAKSSCGFIGVTRAGRGWRFKISIRQEGKYVYITGKRGFATAEDAAKAYDEAAAKLRRRHPAPPGNAL